MIAFRAEWVSFEELKSEKTVLVKSWCVKGEPLLKLSANKLIQQTAKVSRFLLSQKCAPLLPAADEGVRPVNPGGG